MKILAFAATSSRQSINKQLVGYATRLLGETLGDEIEMIDLNDFEMPIYSIDRQREGGIPQPAHDFFAAIGRADALVISFAEHNGFYTTAYKNVFDWASRIDMRVYQDRQAVLLSTSIGQGGGANVLQTAVASGVFFGYDVKASLSVPSFRQNFDETTGSLADAELDARLREALSKISESGNGDEVAA